MSENWNYVKFGDLFNYENKSKIKAGDGLIEGTYPFYTSSVELTKYVNESQFGNISLVFGTGGNASIHYVDTPFSVSTDCLVAFAKDPSKVYSKFAYYYLSGNINLLEEGFKGAGLKHISKGYINEILIPIPPLATQKRIAEILDAADALRRNDQELLKKYDELAQAIFIDMFGDPVKNEKGWNISALEELCIDIVDCPHSTPNHTEEITEFPCIRTSEMKNGKISWGSMKYLKKEDYSIRVKRLAPEAGDIVYAREGTYGEAVLLPKNYHFALGQRTMLLRPNSNLVSNEFLWFQINSDYVYHQAKRKNMGSTVGHVNVADVKKFDILVPPVQLQLKFADVIANLISTESFFESHQADKLFDSLIQKAFKGELVS